MTDKAKNDEGPACACGRVDIYKEMLKSNKTTKDKNDDSTDSCQVGDDKNSDDEASGEDQKQD